MPLGICLKFGLGLGLIQIGLEINFPRWVAEAMWGWLRRLYFAGCRGYVVSHGLTKNKTIHPAWALAELGNDSTFILSLLSGDFGQQH